MHAAPRTHDVSQLQLAHAVRSTASATASTEAASEIDAAPLGLAVGDATGMVQVMVDGPSAEPEPVKHGGAVCVDDGAPAHVPLVVHEFIVGLPATHE